jgi:hypothetical protein
LPSQGSNRGTQRAHSPQGPPTNSGADTSARIDGAEATTSTEPCLGERRHAAGRIEQGKRRAFVHGAAHLGVAGIEPRHGNEAGALLLIGDARAAKALLRMRSPAGAAPDLGTSIRQSGSAAAAVP